MVDHDSQLHRKVDRLDNLVVRMEQQVAQVSQGVSGVALTQQETRTELGALAAEFRHFVQKADRDKNLLQAEARVGSLEANLEQQFGHYKKVRRSATGLLQAFDVGLVSSDTVRTIGEELMIDAPRYWLAPALVALSAWAQDDRRLCDKAILVAFSRSPSRTALFFSLVLRRQGRLTPAARWLRHYLGALDPSALGRDFAVILEAIAQGAFGAAGRELVQQTLAGWAEQLGDDEAATAAQVARWRAEIDRYRTTPGPEQFPKLSAVSPQWPDLSQVLGSAQVHQALLDTYRAMMAEEPRPSARIEDAVDDILDGLVREYDPEELPLKRSIDRQRAIIDAEGDIDVAGQQADEHAAARDDTLDYLTIQSISALLPEQIGVSRATQRVAVSACEPWFRQAHEQFSADYRQRLPSDVEARFDSTHNSTAGAFKLPTWTGSFVRPMPELEQSLGRHWDRAGRAFLDTLRYDYAAKAILPGLAVLAIFVLIGASGSWISGFVVALVVGAIWGGVIWSHGQDLEKKRAEMERVLTNAKSESLSQLRQAGAELVDWSSRFSAADGKETQVRAMLDDLRKSGQPIQRFEQRTLTSS